MWAELLTVSAAIAIQEAASGETAPPEEVCSFPKFRGFPYRCGATSVAVKRLLTVAYCREKIISCSKNA